MSTETPEQPATSSSPAPATSSFGSGSTSLGTAPGASSAAPPEPVVEPVAEPTPEGEKPDLSDLSHDELVALRTLPTSQTAVDVQGTTRIVVPDLNVSGWQPAPLEPDAEEVARLEKVQAAIVAQDQARAEALGLTGQ